jgi:hypothetical protein
MRTPFQNARSLPERALLLYAASVDTDQGPVAFVRKKNPVITASTPLRARTTSATPTNAWLSQIGSTRDRFYMPIAW